jgi:gamma-glutamylcyclotransferase (GGCT)/AIG2-like uncharacterized protein YtfP
MLLFVYGTLRRASPHPMARRLAERARFVAAAQIAGRLYNLGRYPGLVDAAAPDDVVQGDVYDLGDDAELLAELDRYENGESPRPAYFDRQTARVTLEDGTECAAQVYWFRGNVAEDMWIESGCWMPREGES